LRNKPLEFKVVTLHVDRVQFDQRLFEMAQKLGVTLSKARSYKEIGEFLDTHDLAEYWEQTQPVEFELDIQSEVT
jgi:hypothetical protein